MTVNRAKKDEFQKALAVYNQAIKEFHKGEFEKSSELLKSFIEKYPAEREVVDRAQAYLSIAQKRLKKESVSLKSFDDYHRYAVVKINQGDYEGALKLLEKAQDFKENEGLVQFLMADVYCLSGQLETALDHLRKAIQKDKTLAVLAQNETDFTALWDDKKFKLLTRLA